MRKVSLFLFFWVFVGSLSGCALALKTATEIADDASKAEERAGKLEAYPRAFSAYLKTAVPDGTTVLPIGLTRILTEIRGDETVAELRGGFVLGAGCRINGSKYRSLSDWLIDIEEADFRDTFDETLTEMGYVTVKHSDDVFATSAVDSRIAFQVAATLIDIDLDLCMEANWWTGEYTWKAHGTGAVLVEWQVYSNFDRRTVHKTSIWGNAALAEPTASGVYLLLQGSFREAVRKLGEQPAFLEAVTYRGPLALSGASASKAAGPRPSREPLSLAERPPFKASFDRNSQEVLEATVLIQTAGGHGSGFIVSQDGLVLTNQHVVGDAELVRVQLHSGLRIDAKVERIDRPRDVALLRLPVSGTKALPIRRRPSRVGETIFAIGSPVSAGLKNTVTRGVVSGFREHPVTGLPLIQADADLHGGNSGGPLVDASGNVLGIALGGIGRDDTLLSGLNFFIPIDSALQHLDIVLSAEPST